MEPTGYLERQKTVYGAVSPIADLTIISARLDVSPPSNLCVKSFNSLTDEEMN